MRTGFTATGTVMWVAVVSALAASGLRAAAPDDSALASLRQCEPVAEAVPGPYRVRCTIGAPSTWPAGAGVAVVYNRTSPTDGSVVLVGPGRVRHFRIGGGKVLSRAESAPVALGGQAPLVIRRDGWRTAVLYGGEVVLRTYEPGPNAGQVGATSSDAAVSVADLLVQPFSEVTFAANFATAEPIPAGWDVIQGQWATTGLEGPAPRPDLAANPFVYGVAGLDPGLTTTGHWFWDGYQLEVSAKPVGSGGAIGLVAYCEDASNYVLFRWVRQTGRRERQLIEVRDGQFRLLAAGNGGYEPRQWYRLALRVDDGYVEALIDGQVALRARTAGLTLGPCGLYAVDAEHAAFDDVRVVPWHFYADDPATEGDGAWQAVQGEWTRDGGKLIARNSRGGALAVCGDPSWTDDEVRATVHCGKAGTVGLVFGYRDRTHTYVLRTSDGESWQAVRRADGAETPLFSGRGPRDGGQGIPVRVRRAGGIIQAWAGDQLLGCAGDSTFPDGQAGVLADAVDGAAFSAFQTRACDPPPPLPDLTDQFTQEATMVGWASPAGLWSSPTGDPPVQWYQAQVMGDAQIAAYLPNAGGQEGTLILRVHGSPEAPGTGWSAQFAVHGAQGLGVQITANGQTLATAEGRPWSTEGPGHELRLVHQGPMVAAFADDTCLVTVTDPTPASHTGVAIGALGLPLDLMDVEVRSPSLVEYTFSEAPSDWYVGRGVWEVTDRWKCSPGWAWLCGYKDDAPTLWSKRVFEGDQVAEVYCAMRMDIAEDPHYDRPSDLNMTLCGDGVRRDSGYTLIFGGWNPGRDRWNEAKSALLRGREIVAERPDVKFNVAGGNDTWHRHWFHVRMEKRGAQVLVDIDGQRVFEFTDPKPLPGGRVAFWTYKNGYMIARTRVAFARGGQIEPIPPKPADDSDDIPFSLYGK